MKEFDMSLLLVHELSLFCLVKLNLIAGFTRHKETQGMKLKIELDSDSISHNSC